MATLKSLRVPRTNTGKQKAGQGRYQKNRELYDGKVGDNRRFAILGRFVPRPKDYPRFKPWNSRPDAPLCVHCMEIFKHNPKHIVRQAGKEFNKLLSAMPKEQQQAMNNLRAVFVSLAEKLVDAPDPQQVMLTAAYLQTVIDGEVIVAKEINPA